MVGIGWTVFSLGTLIELRSSSRLKISEVLPLLAGAGLIGTIDILAMAAAMTSQYLSSQNIAYGLAAIAIMKAELHLPLSLLWTQINVGVGGVLSSRGHCLRSQHGFMAPLWTTDQLSVADASPPRL